MRGLVVQLSVAVGVAGVGIVAPHSMVILTGIPASTGAVRSWTVITWLLVLVLPQLSLAVHTLVNV